MQAKIVGDNHYHLWTDALHGRRLAHQAGNKWDRGTYVRWTITTAWTVLEVACQDALKSPRISYSFKDNMDEAITGQNLQSIDWGKGLWQNVRDLQEQRKRLSHRFLSESDLFPTADRANDAIRVVRAGVRDIYQRTGQSYPTWIEDDEDRGWDQPSSFGISLVAHANPDDPSAVKIFIVRNGDENLVEVHPPGTDHIPHIADILSRSSSEVPYSRIRVRVGEKVIYERETNMRGSE